MSGIEVFSKNANVVFIEKSEFFFSKKPLFLTKAFSFQENLNFDNLKRVFPAFCTICMTNRRPKAWKMRAILTRPNLGSLKFICDSYSTL